MRCFRETPHFLLEARVNCIGPEIEKARVGTPSKASTSSLRLPVSYPPPPLPCRRHGALTHDRHSPAGQQQTGSCNNLQRPTKDGKVTEKHESEDTQLRRRPPFSPLPRNASLYGRGNPEKRTRQHKVFFRGGREAASFFGAETATRAPTTQKKEKSSVNSPSA